MKLFGKNEKIRLRSCVDGETMTEMCLLSTGALPALSKRNKVSLDFAHLPLIYCP